MKKLILAIALFVGITTASAQVTTATNLVGGAYGLTVDTVDNTESITKFVRVTQSNTTISIQTVITKISGTVAGTVIPVGSNDGINFVPLSRASVAATTLRPSYTDTLTATNVTTNTKIWVFTNASNVESGQTPGYGPYLYYGLKYTGSGTMSAKFRGYVVGRQ